MAFGRMAADSEILAAKASGVSLYRIVAPVLLIGAILGTGLVCFNNEVLPDANHKARLLMSDIRRKRPTLDLKPNVMEDRIAGYHLLIKEIDPRSSKIADITIFEQKGRQSPRTVVAKKGDMSYSADGRTLILKLFDGEIHETDPNDIGKYRRTAFEQQTFYLGGVDDEFNRTDSEYRTDREKSAKQMLDDIAVWQNAIIPHEQSINYACSSMVSALFVGLPDSMNPQLPLPIESSAFDRASNRAEARERAANRAERIAGIIQREEASIANQTRLIDQYRIEIHKKYSIPAACVVFVLVGSPLGVRARRGGLGVGMGVSLGLFLVYWAFLIGGEDLADRGIVSPVWAMWSADILIGAVGLILLWSITNEVSLSPRQLWHRMTRHVAREAAP
jgi:lipopolysaccharide export system permease protein